jgi:hypothetical protein
MYSFITSQVRRLGVTVVRSLQGFLDRTDATASDHARSDTRPIETQDQSSITITEGRAQFSGSGQLGFTEIRASQNDYVRTASRRLREARETLQEVTTPISPADTSTLLERQQKLEWVFEQCWSLVDSSKHEGVSKADVETLLRSSFDVRLAHDLGNLAKHRNLTRRTWTGKTPAFGKPEMVTTAGGSVGGGVTRFELAVLLDSASQGQGADVASRALNEWEAALRGWGIG